MFISHTEHIYMYSVSFIFFLSLLFFQSSTSFPFPWQLLTSVQSLPLMCFLCEWEQSGPTPQPAIKHLHHVVLWSEKERQRRETQRGKSTDKKKKRRGDRPAVIQKNEADRKRRSSGKDSHRQTKSVKDRERDRRTAEQLWQKNHCLSASRSRVHQQLVHSRAKWCLYE